MALCLFQMVNALHIGQDYTRIGTVVFSEGASLHFSLTDYYDKAKIQQAITNMPYMGGFTNYAGMSYSFTCLRKSNSD